MNNQLELSQLTDQQLNALAWELKGTPAVQPVYSEMSNRPARVSVKPDDPTWDEKITAMILSKRLSEG